MNLAQMYNLGDLTRTITVKAAGNKLTGERLYSSVKSKSTQFTGQLRGRAKHWLVIDGNFSLPDFVSVSDFPVQRAEHTGSTLLLIDLSKIDSEMHAILQWSQNNAFLPIHILGTRKPSIDAERPTKRRRLGANNSQLFNHQQVLNDPNEPASFVTNPVVAAHPTQSSQTIQQDNDPLSTLFYASNTSSPSNPSSTTIASNANVLREQSYQPFQHKSADESSSESSEDYDNDMRAFKLLARAKDQLKSPDAKIRAKCMKKLFATVIGATELIASNPILADTICQCIVIGLQDKDKETRNNALSCLTAASREIGSALQVYHEDILPLVIDTVLSPLESSKWRALNAAEYYLRDVQVPSSLIEEHFDELMTNLIRTINEPVEWDKGMSWCDLDEFCYEVFKIILTLIEKYPQLTYNEYIYKLLPHIKITLDEGDKSHTKTAKKLIQKLLKPIASTALELCSLVLEATKEESNTDTEDRFKSSMMNVLYRSAPNFSE